MHSIQTASVTMTRAEAEAMMKYIDERRKVHVGAIAVIARKRKWRDAEKAMAVAEQRMKLQLLEAMHERIGTAFNLGGW